MKYTIEDVAKKSGLSVVTVSRYINGAQSVREKNRIKIQEAMEALNYTPSAAARALSRRKTGVIGLLVSHIKDHNINDIICSITKSLGEKNSYLALSVVDEDNACKNSFLFEKDRVDGVIIYSSLLSDAAIMNLKNQGIPVVIINGKEKDKNFLNISTDDYLGGQIAAEHLLQCGHKEFGYISGPKSSRTSNKRQAGYLDKLNAAGINEIEIIEGAYTVESGYKCAKWWIENNKIPSAIFAADDQNAFGAINAIKDYGLKIPKDISIIGYDNHTFSNQFHPTLTTISHQSEIIGNKTVEALFEQLDSKNTSYKNQLIKPELIIRESTRSIE